MNWFRDKSGKIWIDWPLASGYSLNTERMVNHPGSHASLGLYKQRRYKMASATVIAAAEALLAALKAETCSATAARSGNRTPATTTYRAGSNPVQDVVDCLRRAVRKSAAGMTLSKKERNVMRNSIKALKATRRYGIMNTNGSDYLTQNGA